MEIYNEFRDMVKCLNNNTAQYLVIGGYAVNHYGFSRFTGDFDIWVNKTPANAEKVLKSIVDFGFGSLGITKEDLMKDDAVIQLGYPPVRIDFLIDLHGVPFNECFQRRKDVEIENIIFPFIHVNDLIESKIIANRDKDQLDVKRLIKIVERSKKSK
jgi:predicted nucleotidyltransferase